MTPGTAGSCLLPPRCPAPRDGSRPLLHRSPASQRPCSEEPRAVSTAREAELSPKEGVTPLVPLYSLSDRLLRPPEHRDSDVSPGKKTQGQVTFKTPGRPAQSDEHETLDLGVVSSSPVLDVEVTGKDEREERRESRKETNAAGAHGAGSLARRAPPVSGALPAPTGGRPWPRRAERRGPVLPGSRRRHRLWSRAAPSARIFESPVFTRRSR